MSRDFQQTHENLLLCAQKHFLEYGFERASIREICKDAHVTNGAFITTLTIRKLCSARWWSLLSRRSRPSMRRR